MSRDKTNIIFLGPSAQKGCDFESLLPNSFKVFPPVKRGDIAQLIRTTTPGTLVIVDGMFHNCLSVGHMEIRGALRSGWRVWGLSSMGAIRACEMRDFGMKGFGRVYERYVSEEDFQDDEVALLHGHLPPYPAVSEPLIHLRTAMEELKRLHYLSSSKANEIIDHLKKLWYGGRTLNLFQSLVMKSVERKKRANVAGVLSEFARFRIKTLDLKRFLQEQPWRGDSATSRLP